MATFIKPNPADAQAINLDLVWIVQPYVKKEGEEDTTYWLKVGFLSRTEFVNLRYKTKEDMWNDYNRIAGTGEVNESNE